MKKNRISFIYQNKMNNMTRKFMKYLVKEKAIKLKNNN